MRISTSITFAASHAVASDPKYSEQHPHHWKLRAFVEGPLVGPGWVISFEALRGIMREVEPLGGESFNEWTGEDDATNEVIVCAMASVIATNLQVYDQGEPRLVALDLFELDEAGNETNGVHWP